MSTKWFKAAQLNAIPVQEGRRVCFGSHEIALFYLGDDKFKAIDNRCPHKQGPLADGIIAGDSVFCPLHNWRISLETGCALTQGPGQVKVYPTKVLKGNVYVALEEGVLHEA